MSRLKKAGYFIFMAFMLQFTLMLPAFAYIDTGTVSLIIQVVSGVVIAAGVMVGVFWRKIKMFFVTRKTKRLEKKLSKKKQ